VYYKKVAFTIEANKVVENEKKGYDWFYQINGRDIQVTLIKKCFYELDIPEFTGRNFPSESRITGNESFIEMVIDYYKDNWLKSKEFAIHGDMALGNIIIDDNDSINIVDWEHFHFANPVYFGFDIINMLFISFYYQSRRTGYLSKRTKAFLRKWYKQLSNGVGDENKILEKPFQSACDYLKNNYKKFRINIDIGEKFIITGYPRCELQKLDSIVTKDN